MPRLTRQLSDNPLITTYFKRTHSPEVIDLTESPYPSTRARPSKATVPSKRGQKPLTRGRSNKNKEKEPVKSAKAVKARKNKVMIRQGPENLAGHAIEIEDQQDVELLTLQLQVRDAKIAALSAEIKVQQRRIALLEKKN